MRSHISRQGFRRKTLTSLKGPLSACLIGVSLLGVAGCSAVDRYHGYVPFGEDMAQIGIGTTTREEVRNLIGPPTSQGVSTDNAFYYVRSRFRHFGPLEPREIEREVMAIRFDANDRVANISRYGLEDGRVVVLSRRVTDDNSDDISLITAILGNFGNFNAGDFLNQ